MTEPETNDGLSRCDQCHKITPHEKLIQLMKRKSGAMGYYCSWDCAVDYHDANASGPIKA